MQLCVLRLGLLQDGDVGIGILPQRKEVLIHTLTPRFGRVTGRPVGAADLKKCSCAAVYFSDARMRTTSD